MESSFQIAFLKSVVAGYQKKKVHNEKGDKWSAWAKNERNRGWVDPDPKKPLPYVPEDKVLTKP